MTTSLPIAVSGEVITSAWANQARTELGSADDRLDLLESYNTVGGTVFVRSAQAGPFDSSGAGYIDWVPMGNVVVPTWAKRAAVTMAVNGSMTSVAATGIICTVQAAIGAAAGQGSGRLDYPAAQLRINTGWTDLITLVGTGTQALKTMVARLAGSGASGRADSGTITTALIQFLPA